MSGRTGAWFAAESCAAALDGFTDALPGEPGVHAARTARARSMRLAARGFGDHLDDLGMLDTADWSLAMASVHPEVVRRARRPAPSGSGVLRTFVRVAVTCRGGSDGGIAAPAGRCPRPAGARIGDGTSEGCETRGTAWPTRPPWPV
ncbi:hypothetical protein [Streptomyces sp. MUM 2J]|uniref:hypothetical protein n=1 Tax=unclassified Streptomyces TaxID=2593676 RepID=UPI0035AB7868